MIQTWMMWFVRATSLRRDDDHLLVPDAARDTHSCSVEGEWSQTQVMIPGRLPGPEGLVAAVSAVFVSVGCIQTAS